MSTYLIAILISDFKCKHGLANAGPTGKVNMSICARSNAFNQLDYSLSLTSKVIENYEKYFDIDYSIKKCDNIAVPDFLLGK
jgi:aminopeptidase N